MDARSRTCKLVPLLGAYKTQLGGTYICIFIAVVLYFQCLLSPVILYISFQPSFNSFNRSHRSSIPVLFIDRRSLFGFCNLHYLFGISTFGQNCAVRKLHECNPLLLPFLSGHFNSLVSFARPVHSTSEFAKLF